MRRAGSSSGASIMRGKQQESNARASTRTAGESGVGRLSRKVSGPSGVLVEIVTPVSRGVAGTPAGRGCVVIVDGDLSGRPEQTGREYDSRRHSRYLRACLAASSRAGRLATPPARSPSGAEGQDRATGPRYARAPMRFRLSGLHGGSKNWATSSRQRARPNQALSRLLGHRLRVEPEPEGVGFGSGIGQVEDQARAFVGQIAKEVLMLPRVAGPPEDHRQVGLEQRTDGARVTGRSPADRPAARSARSRPGAAPAPASDKAPTPRH